MLDTENIIYLKPPTNSHYSPYQSAD